MSVGLYATASVCVHQQLNWCALDELSFSCLMPCINTNYQKLPFGSGDDPDYAMKVLLLWDVLHYFIIVLHIKILCSRSDLNLCLQPLASHHSKASYYSEAQNDQSRRVKQEFKKTCDETAPF